MDYDSGHDDYKLRPCLRPVEVIPVDQDGQQMVALGDSTGVVFIGIGVYFSLAYIFCVL